MVGNEVAETVEKERRAHDDDAEHSGSSSSKSRVNGLCGEVGAEEIAETHGCHDESCVGLRNASASDLEREYGGEERELEHDHEVDQDDGCELNALHS